MGEEGEVSELDVSMVAGGVEERTQPLHCVTLTLGAVGSGARKAFSLFTAGQSPLSRRPESSSSARKSREGCGRH